MLWVIHGSVPFAHFNFELEYQKGHDNMVVDTLSRVTTQLDPNTVRSMLDGVTLGSVHQAEVLNPTIVKGDCHLEQVVHIAAGCALVQLIGLKLKEKT